MSPPTGRGLSPATREVAARPRFVTKQDLRIRLEPARPRAGMYACRRRGQPARARRLHMRDAVISRWWASLAVAAALLLGPGCGSPTQPTPSPSPTPTPVVTVPTLMAPASGA